MKKCSHCDLQGSPYLGNAHLVKGISPSPFSFCLPWYMALPVPSTHSAYGQFRAVFTGHSICLDWRSRLFSTTQAFAYPSPRWTAFRTQWPKLDPTHVLPLFHCPVELVFNIAPTAFWCLLFACPFSVLYIINLMKLEPTLVSHPV